YNISLGDSTLSFSPGITAQAVAPPCDEDLFDSNVDNCLSDFNKSMETSDYQSACPWPVVKSNYYKLMSCVEDGAKKTWCRGYGFLVDEIYLEVHQTYFSLCGWVHDPPLFTLIMLIAPGIIVTLFLPFLCVHITPREV
uniref:Uncharacterized protein n=1 Tax=Amphilophus citrinellus TaxID=61819 RepID=A0A3Q0QZS3_AMPCI